MTDRRKLRHSGWLRRQMRGILDRDRRYGLVKIFSCLVAVQGAATWLAVRMLPHWPALVVIVLALIGSCYAWFRVLAEPYRYVAPLNMDPDIPDDEFLDRADTLRAYPLLGQNRFQVVLTGREVDAVLATSWWLRLKHGRSFGRRF